MGSIVFFCFLAWRYFYGASRFPCLALFSCCYPFIAKLRDPIDASQARKKRKPLHTLAFLVVHGYLTWGLRRSVSDSCPMVLGLLCARCVIFLSSLVFFASPGYVNDTVLPGVIEILGIPRRHHKRGGFSWVLFFLVHGIMRNSLLDVLRYQMPGAARFSSAMSAPTSVFGPPCLIVAD